MNIVFFGTSEFAVPSLKALVNSRHKVLALVTQPDRKRGRQLKLSPPAAKVVALAENIPVFQPQDASGRESIEYLKGLNADLFVVIAFGQILKKDLLAVPRLYCINIHGSLLPLYRGAAPTNRAVMNGDRTSGITIIRMNERMDEGDIIISKETTIDREDTNITLGETLADLGASALLETLELIENGREINFRKQDSSRSSLAPKLKKVDGLIDWRLPAAILHNRVRGLLPWPGAYTHYEGKVLKVLKTKPDKTDSPADAARCGTVSAVIPGEGIAVQTGSGTLIIQYLQLEGKKELDADSFLRGHRIPIGYKFG